MSFNTVRIDQNNLPQLCDHELFLHSISTCTLLAKSGNAGYAGAGFDLTLQGALYLTPFRVIFIPHLPSQGLFSFSMPFATMGSIKSNFSTVLTTPRRDYSDGNSIPLEYHLTAPNGNPPHHDHIENCYQFHHGNNTRNKLNIGVEKHNLKFNLRPLNTLDVALLQSYKHIFEDNNRAMPRLGGFMPSSHFTGKPIQIEIIFGNTGSCTIHNDSIPNVLQEDDNNGNGRNELITSYYQHNKGIKCYHYDFLFSFLRCFDFIHYIIVNSHPERVPEQYLHNIHLYMPVLLQKYVFRKDQYSMIHDQNNHQNIHNDNKNRVQITHLPHSAYTDNPPEYASINTISSETLYTPLLGQDLHGNYYNNVDDFYFNQNNQNNQNDSSNYSNLYPQNVNPSSNTAQNKVDLDTYGGFNYGQYYTPPSNLSFLPQEDIFQENKNNQNNDKKLPPPPLLNPYAPWLLMIYLSMHAAQPIEVGGYISHIVGIKPWNMYSEFGSMKIKQNDD
jgi:hypothetical protein